MFCGQMQSFLTDPPILAMNEQRIFWEAGSGSKYYVKSSTWKRFCQQ